MSTDKQFSVESVAGFSPRAWIVDVDGCLVKTTKAGGRGGVPMPRAADFIRLLQEIGEPYVVCTNASDHLPTKYSAELREMGIPISDEHFATAGSVTADYIAAHHPGQSVIALGSTGFLDTLRSRGITLADPGQWGQAGAVVVGADHSYDMARVSDACLAAEAGAPLYQTVGFPWFHGGVAKGAASSSVMAAGVAWAAGVKPITTGKPSAALGFTLASQMGVDPTSVVVVGDAIVEVELGRNIGGSSYLLLSGSTSAEEAEALRESERPAAVFPAIEDLYNYLTKSAG